MGITRAIAVDVETSFERERERERALPKPNPSQRDKVHRRSSAGRAPICFGSSGRNAVTTLRAGWLPRGNDRKDSFSADKQGANRALLTLREVGLAARDYATTSRATTEAR
jgi:hypothetical protein